MGANKVIKLKYVLLEYNSKVSKYSDELGAYITQLRPNIRGWKFSIDRMTGSWEWENRKFEDVVYATWGWEGKNEIPVESSDGIHFKTIKIKLTPPKDTTDMTFNTHQYTIQLKKDAKKYIDTMKKEFPKIEKKLLEY
mgnify:CR=1 FL=1